MYVKIDKETGELNLALPAQYSQYEAEVSGALYEEYAFEALNNAVLARMDEFVRSWFEAKGIHLPVEEEKS
jgi:hypothetical protein